MVAVLSRWNGRVGLRESKEGQSSYVGRVCSAIGRSTQQRQVHGEVSTATLRRNVGSSRGGSKRLHQLREPSSVIDGSGIHRFAFGSP